MEEQFVTALAGSTAVTDYTGNRINFGSHPQGAAWPAIVLNTVSDVSSYALTGPSGPSEARVQADCYAEDYPTAKLLSRAVIARLSGYSGGTVLGVFHVATRDGREGITEADRPFRVSLDFQVRFHR